MWRNWSRELDCTPRAVARPTSTEQVIEVVRAAAERGMRVRPVGAGHSFSALALTDGVMVDVRALDSLRVLDRDAGIVQVGAGLRLGRWGDRLARLGLAPENLGDIDVQTVAGAIATGTHGAGSRLGNLSSQVVGLRLVDGRGEVHELGCLADGGASGPDDAGLLRAARVSLGALGIVTDVALRVLPAYTLRGHDRVEPRDLVLATFDERSDAHRHLDVYLFPYSRHALTRTNDVVDLPADPPRPLRRWVQDRFLTTYTFGAVTAAGRAMPRAIPAFNRVVSRLAGSPPRVDAAHHIFASPRDVRFTEMELAVPREHGARFAHEVVDLVESERLPVSFPIEVRSVAADDALLSPAVGRDSVYVAVHNAVGLPFDAYLEGVWELAQRYTPRPHWGKRHLADAADLAPRYPGWDTFRTVRARMDPDGRFRNAHLDHVLGPIGSARA